MRFLDIQDYTLNRKKFIPKEVAMYDGNAGSHYIFKPPFKFSALSTENKKQVMWLEKHYHGIKWSDGWVNLTELPNILFKDCSNQLVYVKGFDKTKFIQNVAKNCDIREYPFPEPCLHKSNLRPNCFNHGSNTHCVISNAVSNEKIIGYM